MIAFTVGTQVALQVFHCEFTSFGRLACASTQPSTSDLRYRRTWPEAQIASGNWRSFCHLRSVQTLTLNSFKTSFRDIKSMVITLSISKKAAPIIKKLHMTTALLNRDHQGGAPSPVLTKGALTGIPVAINGIVCQQIICVNLLFLYGYLWDFME